MILAILASLLAAAAVAHALHRYGLIAIPDPARRIGCIDGIRGYLAIGVLINHFRIWLQVMDGGPWTLTRDYILHNLGTWGVAVFFMITGTLFYPKVASGFRKVDWISLYISRVFRLGPMLWLATLIVAAVILIRSGGTFQGSVGENLYAMSKWMTIRGNPDLFGFEDSALITAGVTWTLLWERNFYLSLPIIAVTLGLLGRFVPAAITLAALAIALIVAVSAGVGTSIYGFSYIPCFALGMLAAELAKSERLREMLRSGAAATIGLAAVVVALTLVPHDQSNLMLVLIWMFYLPVVAGNSYFSSLSRNSSVVLSELSYGIYLLHGIVLYVVMSGITGRISATGTLIWYMLPPVTALVVIVAAIARVTVEQPGISLGRHLSKYVRKLIRGPSPALAT